VPGGESAREALARAREAFDALLASSGSLIAVASHGQLLSLLLHSIDGRFGYDGWQSLSNPDVLLVSADRAGALAFTRIWKEDPR
jgi:2,3-bisphosphoglycerate-dependent phosphoglycerate mutase